MTIVEFPCTRCGKVLRLTRTSSLYQADGTPHPVFCADCYEYLKNPNNWRPLHEPDTP